MLNPEEASVAKVLFAKSKRNLDDPLIGRVFTSICVSCSNRIENGDWKAPTCAVYDKIPDIYTFGVSNTCPKHKKTD